jgi:hypothetical protein
LEKNNLDLNRSDNPFFLLLNLPQIKKQDWCGTSGFFWLGKIGFLIVEIENQ